jgi:hypothetical protein
VHEIADRVHVGHQMRAAEIECHEVGFFTHFEGADLGVEPHRAGTPDGSHAEDVARLPGVAHLAVLHACHR